MRLLKTYLSALPPGKQILWCYLIWYLVTVCYRFDPSPALWVNSLGISAIIGTALLLSVAPPAGQKPDPWQIFRLFLMPFCVSSFAALIKGHGYVLVFPASARELLVSSGACALFLLLAFVLRRTAGKTTAR